MGYGGFLYRFVFAELFDYKNCQLSILFYCLVGVNKITYGSFCFTVALAAATKAETLVF
jgi:hypothetical protein